MNVTVPFRAQLENLPGGIYVSQALSQFSAAIGAVWAGEHTDAGGHTTITATGPISERGRTTPLGAWIDPPFDATRFTAAVGTWAVPAPTPGNAVSTIGYTLVGTTMFFQIDVITSTLTTAGTSTVYVALPTPYRLAGQPLGSSFTNRAPSGFAFVLNGATVMVGFISGTPGSNLLSITVNAPAVLATGGLTVVGQSFFEVTS